MFQKNPYKTRWYHRKLSSVLYRYQVQEEGKLDEMEVVRLDVEPGHKPNNKTPVRIYLGTQDEQYRAERVFIWSVKKHRDPARVYEIYMMRSIKGISRVGWKTGFSLYRYGIPELAGSKGKAIYNDVDQIYLTDPAELFDTDMGDAGVMAINEKENSVMLIDCEKMVKYWNIAKLNEGMRHKYFRAQAVDNGMWAKMEGVWNTRDSEWPIEKTKCLHYTTLQTQPWKPFPKQLRYRPNPVGYVWFDMEKEADEAGFMTA